MSDRAIQLITVSRELGAGGSELARQLGSRLEWPVLDHDIVHRVAQRLRLDDGIVEQLDEHPPSLLARIAAVLIIPYPDLYTLPPESGLPGPDDIAAASRTVIEEAATATPLIIVGHGAHCIFAKRSGTLHLRVAARIGDRVSRVMSRMAVDPAYASALVRRSDHDREAYVRRYFHRDLTNDLFYDLQINTSTISVEEAVELVSGLVQGRDAMSTPGTT